MSMIGTEQLSTPLFLTYLKRMVAWQKAYVHSCIDECYTNQTICKTTRKNVINTVHMLSRTSQPSTAKGTLYMNCPRKALPASDLVSTMLTGPADGASLAPSCGHHADKKASHEAGHRLSANFTWLPLLCMMPESGSMGPGNGCHWYWSNGSFSCWSLKG